VAMAAGAIVIDQPPRLSPRIQTFRWLCRSDPLAGHPPIGAMIANPNLHHDPALLALAPLQAHGDRAGGLVSTYQSASGPAPAPGRSCASQPHRA